MRVQTVTMRGRVPKDAPPVELCPECKSSRTILRGTKLVMTGHVLARTYAKKCFYDCVACGCEWFSLPEMFACTCDD